MRRIALAIGLAVLFAVFFRISGVGVAILVLGTGVWAIWAEKIVRRENGLQKDFLQMTEYLQGMGMSFLLSKTAYTALKDNVTLFAKSKIQRVLSEAVEYVEKSMDGKGMSGAFSRIERAYPCKKLHRLHNYILTASDVGGDFSKGLRLLLAEQEQWKKRQMLSYTDLCADRRKVWISVVLTILLCGYVAKVTLNEVDVTGTSVYRIGMILFWFGCLGVLLLAIKGSTMDWYDKQETYSEKEIQEKLLRHKEDETGKKIGYATRQRILQKELIKAFPEWMLEVALRMENKNVEVALRESYENAPTIIRFYLGRMLKELKQHPTEPDAYFHFAEELKIPEVTNSMKLLYAMSKGIVAGGDEHIKELIERNCRLDEQAATFRIEKKRSLMYGCLLLPSVLGAGCMILNMSLMLIEFMKNLKV